MPSTGKSEPSGSIFKGDALAEVGRRFSGGRLGKERSKRTATVFGRHTRPLCALGPAY